MTNSDIYATIALVISLVNLTAIMYGIWRLRD